jgi:uncharacterized oxidoreductase
MKLEGNTVLITGGTSGIGLELANELLKRKNTVLITGRDDERLDRAKAQLQGVHTIRCDVSAIADVDALFSRVTRDFPGLNVLVNNAGVMRTLDLQDEARSLDDVTREIDTNFKGPLWMIQRFLPQLKKMPSAAIVNVSSGLAFVPLPSAPVYCATKAAMHSFSRSLRVQLRKTTVKVFELAPPATETGLFDAKAPGMEQVALMKVDALVRDFLKGFERDQLEIRPGQANQLKLMNRLAPEFIFAQLTKPMDRLLGKGN